MSQNTFCVSIFDVPSNQINVQCLNIKSTSPRNHFRMRSRIIQDFWNETKIRQVQSTRKIKLLSVWPSIYTHQTKFNSHSTEFLTNLFTFIPAHLFVMPYVSYRMTYTVWLIRMEIRNQNFKIEGDMVRVKCVDLVSKTSK